MSAKARHVDYPGFCSLHASRIREVLLRIILTELDREIAGWCVNADGLGRSPLPKNQPAEITMFQISEVQEAPAFNGGRSFLTLRSSLSHHDAFQIQLSQKRRNAVSRPGLWCPGVTSIID
jgi:hypothetical protein